MAFEMLTGPGLRFGRGRSGSPRGLYQKSCHEDPRPNGRPNVPGKTAAGRAGGGGVEPGDGQASRSDLLLGPDHRSFSSSALLAAPRRQGGRRWRGTPWTPGPVGRIGPAPGAGSVELAPERDRTRYRRRKPCCRRRPDESPTPGLGGTQGNAVHARRPHPGHPDLLCPAPAPALNPRLPLLALFALGLCGHRPIPREWTARACPLPEDIAVPPIACLVAPHHPPPKPHWCLNPAAPPPRQCQFGGHRPSYRQPRRVRAAAGAKRR